MSAKIYDSVSQSFKDAEIPKIHNGTAYVDSQGMSYDSGAWKEDWVNKFIIYDYGKQNVPLQRIVGDYDSGKNTLEGMITSSPINFSKYSKLGLTAYMSNHQMNLWLVQFSGFTSTSIILSENETDASFIRTNKDFDNILDTKIYDLNATYFSTTNRLGITLLNNYAMNSPTSYPKISSSSTFKSNNIEIKLNLSYYGECVANIYKVWLEK